MNIYYDRRCIVAGCVVTSISILNGALAPPPVEIERSSLPATRLRGLVTMFMNQPGSRRQIAVDSTVPFVSTLEIRRFGPRVASIAVIV